MKHPKGVHRRKREIVEKYYELVFRNVEFKREACKYKIKKFQNRYSVDFYVKRYFEMSESILCTF